MDRHDFYYAFTIYTLQTEQTELKDNTVGRKTNSHIDSSGFATC